ncbi:dynamin family protein [Neobacillus niacini]|uniref:dynamin family protein n=1 Tax=Neobacillus niacini TaxID=86668 RepID=UPI002FFF185C
MSIWDNHKLEEHEDSLINIYIDNLEQGMNLIGRLLKENNDQSELSEEFGKFSQLIETDFLEMAGKIAIPDNASIYHELLLFKKKLEEYIMFPEIFPKKVVAVGGGFSAGKSKLINLLIGEELLPTDTTPTTSIPTYIMEGNDTNFYAYNIYGLKSELDEEAIKAITHAFSEKYKVSLAQIMKNILLKSSSMKYSNIAILDTPGYSKSDHHKKELNKDEHMARVHLHSADCLIWVVDIEKGTIPNQDFEFIKSMNTTCPIFFVFNKADKKEASDIESIIELSRENVSNQGIECAGIGAISALLKKEYAQDSLFEFLNKENQEKNVPDLSEKFLGIFSKYEGEIEKNILELRKELKELNEIALLTSEKQAQELLRPLIADKKKRITIEKDKFKQFKIDLTPFITSIEKIQELLTKQAIGQEIDYVTAISKQFLQGLLKVNVEKFIRKKVDYFSKGINLEGCKLNQQLSGTKLAELIEDSLLLLQKDIKVKLVKEMARKRRDIKDYLSSKGYSEHEKEEVLYDLSETFSIISERIQNYDYRLEKSHMLTNVLRQHDSFSPDYEALLLEMAVHEGTTTGYLLKERFPRLYQDAITTLAEEKWGQE